MEQPNRPVEHHTGDDLIPRPMRRFIPLLAIVVVSFAAIGYVAGIREPQPGYRHNRQPQSENGIVPAAVTYDELPFPRQPSATSLANLAADRPAIDAPVVRTEDMKLAALADRARNRAFDGAPPTIPHAVDPQSVSACLVCHGEGMKIVDRIASRMSHPLYSNCTQCHVEQSVIPVENQFLGVFRAGPGARANPGAPPAIPHSTWMREQCASCHGLVTRPGTRTTHPWLTNCTQCHAPSAALDQFREPGVLR